MGLLIPSVLVQQPKVKENSVYQYDVLTSYHVTGSQWLLSDQAAHLRTLLEISHPLTKPSQNVNCSLQSDFEIASDTRHSCDSTKILQIFKTHYYSE